MTTTDAIAQLEATSLYRRAELRFRRRARLEAACGHPIGTRIATRLAHHASLAAERNEAGAKPDRWERT